MYKYLFLVTILIIVCSGVEYARFQAIKKYYPELTYFEYVILSDKLRITPED